METPSPDPQPPDSSLGSTTAEVERLLDQAESLANEIATQTGIEPTEREATPSGHLGGPEPDVAAAAAIASEDAARVQEVINESHATEVPVAPVPDAVADAVVDPLSMKEEALDKEPVVPKSDSAVAVHPEIEAPVPPPVESKPDPARRSKSDEKAVAQDTPAATTEPSDSLQSRFGVKSLANWAIMLVLGTLSLVWRAFVLLLVQIDRPFARLSANAKTHIALIGALTLAMGLVSFIAPKFGGHNPYAEMEPFAQQAGPAAAPTPSAHH